MIYNVGDIVNANFYKSFENKRVIVKITKTTVHVTELWQQFYYRTMWFYRKRFKESHSLVTDIFQ